MLKRSKRAAGVPLALVAIAAIVLAGIPTAGCAANAEGAATLENLLPAGESPGWYTQQMESAGYEVTSINYKQDDYVEYEIVKGDESYEVKLDIDPETGKVSKVDVGGNVWKAEETEKALSESRVTVPAGTRIAAKLNAYLDSGESHTGDKFTMTVFEPVTVGNEVAIPVGTVIHGYVESVEEAHRPNEGGRLVLKAESMEVSGDDVDFEGIVTAETGSQGKDSIKEDLKEIAAGAGIGGLVGGLIGGGKGVLAGVLIGGGGTFLATKGQEIKIPPDAELIVELREPVRVVSR